MTECSASNVAVAAMDPLGQLLLDYLRKLQSVAVAFSGGVDSAVVAKAAYLALGDRAIAVTSTSASVAEDQIQVARQIATDIGIRHILVKTDELERSEYQANDARRCYWCKHTLYRFLTTIAQREGMSAMVSGTNADDLGDYRPGIEAGRESRVKTPLADLGITKQQVRQLASQWQLQVWDAPASPCLASRIAYGVKVTEPRLKKIELAEAWLKERGFRELRVRLHEGELARIEIPADCMFQFGNPALVQPLIQYFKSLGFLYVTLDLAGLRSGSLNDLIQIQSATI